MKDPFFTYPGYYRISVSNTTTFVVEKIIPTLEVGIVWYDNQTEEVFWGEFSGLTSKIPGGCWGYVSAVLGVGGETAIYTSSRIEENCGVGVTTLELLEWGNEKIKGWAMDCGADEISALTEGVVIDAFRSFMTGV